MLSQFKVVIQNLKDSEVPVDVKEQFLAYIMYFETWSLVQIQSKGQYRYVQLMKAVRHEYLHKLGECTNPVGEELTFFRRDKKLGLPRVKGLLHLFRGRSNPLFLKVLLTLLFVGRYVPLPTDNAEWSTITTGSHLPVREDMKLFLKESHWFSIIQSSMQALKPIQYHFSTSMGPLGPAMVSSMRDAQNTSHLHR